MKRSLILATMVLFSMTLMSCGQMVEVPSAHTGKIMGKNGYRGGYIPTKRFRLDWCMVYCDRLVILDVSDQPIGESMTLFMPKDKLNMDFDIRLTLAIPEESYDIFYSKVQPQQSTRDSIYILNREKAYLTYAQQIIRTQTREFLSNYTIAEIASNREAINAQLSDALIKSISEKTPFQVRYAGLGDIKYPQIITEAQENAAKRREMIQQEEAQLEISKVSLERGLQEAKLQRAIDVEKAEAEKQVNRILASSVTDAYRQYRMLNALDKLADNENSTFIPFGMLDSYATQRLVTK